MLLPLPIRRILAGAAIIVALAIAAYTINALIASSLYSTVDAPSHVHAIADVARAIDLCETTGYALPQKAIVLTATTFEHCKLPPLPQYPLTLVPLAHDEWVLIDQSAFDPQLGAIQALNPAPASVIPQQARPPTGKAFVIYTSGQALRT